MANRALIIALRMDARQYEQTAADAQRQIRQIESETTRVNRDLAAATRAAGVESVAALEKEMDFLTRKQAQYDRMLASEGLSFKSRSELTSQSMAAAERLAELESKQAAAREQQRTVANHLYREQVKELLRAEEAERLAAARAEQARTETVRRAAAERRGVTDRLYAATHTYQENEIRQLRRYYAEQRLMHRGNADMLSRIDRAYAAERQKIMAQSELAGGGRQRLGGQQTLRYAASQGLGMAGGQAGMLASAAMVGGPMAAAMVGVTALVGAYQAAKVHAQELAEAQRQHTAAVHEAEQAMRAMIQSATTAAGARHRDRAMQMQQSAEARTKEAQRIYDDQSFSSRIADPMGTFAQGWQLAIKGESDRFRLMDELVKTAKMEADEAERRARWAKEELQIRQQQTVLSRQAEVAAMEVSLMRPGGKRNQAAFEQDLANQRRLAAESAAERRREAARAVEQATKAFYATGNASTFKARKDAQEYQQWLEKDLADEERFVKRREELLRQKAAQDRQEAMSDRGRTMRREQMLAQGADHRLLERMDYEKWLTDQQATPEQRQGMLSQWDATWQAKADQPLTKQITEMERETRLLTGALTLAAAAREKLTEANPDASAGKIDELLAAEQKLRQARWADEQRQAIAEMNIQLDLARGKITETEAALRRLAEANKGLTPEEQAGREADLRQRQNMEKEIRLAEWAKRERESLETDEEKLRKYGGKLQEAVSAGDLSRAQQIALLEQKRKELSGGRDEEQIARGQFGGLNARGLAIGGGDRLDRVAKAAESQVTLLDTLIVEVKNLVPLYN